MNAQAAEGLKLLTKRHRTLHPRAQVRALRKMAVIALGKAERWRENAGKYGTDYAADIAQAQVYERKADVALAACIHLNEEHKLGYPVPRG